MYDEGRGIPEDGLEAARWYEAAAEQGVARAQFNIGNMYDNGEGVLQDYSEAVRWYRAAAEQGQASAQNNLALNYLVGAGVPKDLVTSHMWLNIASANGLQDATETRVKVADMMSRDEITEAQGRARTCMESGYQDCD
jgi:TPR repeat protein